MYEMLKDVACVVTAFIGFTYGTRIAWGFGRKRIYSGNQDHRALFLFESVPVAGILYFVGFLVVHNFWITGVVTLTVVSISSALVLSLIVVSVSMPDQRRQDQAEGVVVELVDGSVCRLAKDTFNYYLATEKVKKFKRGNQWAVVGEDPVRKSKDDTIYVGVDRRQQD